MQTLVSFLGKATLLLGLIVLTCWNYSNTREIKWAREAHDEGDPSRALGSALTHLDRCPWSREASRIAAISLSRLDFPDEAEPYYKKVRRLDRESAHYRVEAMIRSNQPEESIAVLRAMIERWPDDDLAHRRLATVYLTQRRLREGRKVVQQLLSLADDVDERVFALTMLGTFNYRLGEPEPTVEAFDRVLEIDPGLKRIPFRDSRWQFWLYFTSQLLELGPVEAERARDFLERETMLHDEHFALLDLLGKAYLKLGQFDKAELAWRRELAVAPNSEAGLYNLGKLLMQRGEYERALPFFEKANQISPNSDQIVYNLIRVNFLLGREDEAARLQAILDQIRDKDGIPTTGMGMDP